MERSGNSEDELRMRIVKEEIEYFEKLINGHRKLLEAIGNM